MTLFEILFIFGILFVRWAFPHAYDNIADEIPRLLSRAAVLILMGSVLPTFSQIFLYYLFGLLALVLDLYWMKNRFPWLYILYMALLFFILPTAGAYLAHLAPGGTNPFYDISGKVLQNIIPLRLVYTVGLTKKVLVTGTGLIFVLYESNVIIRAVLSGISTEPMTEKNETDQDEYNRGRIIGLLERTLLYFLVIFGYYAGIAVVVAVKSIARYREFRNRNFAEYFLIGTLLSITLALGAALYVKLSYLIVFTPPRFLQ